jgi:extracellular factor (EF) 3-hydroxypalmitic acid methyl ester biosynthesis protein
MSSHVRAYEHIGGASGPRIHYRAPRHSVRSLFDGPFPVAVIEGLPHILSDLSTSGLAAYAPPSEIPPLSPGTDLTFALQFGDAVLHSGEAGLVRIEETSLGRKLGLRFHRSDLDIEQVVGRYRQELSRGRLKAGLFAPAPPAPVAFRLLCADLLLALRTCRDVLDEEHHGSTENSDGLIGECLEGIGPVLSPLAQEANRMLEAGLEDPAALEALKRTATQILTPDFVLAPLWSRAVEKPLGYAGDFRLIRALHGSPDGEGSAYVRFLERLGRSVFSWVPNRTKLFIEAIAREIAHHRGQETLQIASVGAGAGEELRGLLARGRPGKAIALTLLDQDEAALAHGYAALHPETLPLNASVSLSCLHASYSQLFAGGELQSALQDQHVIVMPALLDYLRHRPATQLLEALYERLVPGGVIFAGCLRQHDGGARWASELVCDWSMIHRTKDEVLALPAKLRRVRIDARLDKNGDVYLLIIRRPRSDA